MNERPIVSMVIPAHNARATIGVALSSLYSQTWTAWEAIVIDDGSTDDTLNIASALADSRVRVRRQPQGGAAVARNTGLRLAEGDYIGFLDADDFLFPGYLERSIELLRQCPKRTIVTHNAYFLYASGLNPSAVRHRRRPPNGMMAQRTALLHSNFVSIMSVFPRELLNDVASFDVSLDRAEDWDYWLRASFSGWTFAHQATPMALINRAAQSLTSATDRVARAEADILRKVLRTQKLSPRQVRQIKKRLSIGEPSVLLRDSERALLAGDYRLASSLHWTATRLLDASRGAHLRAAAFRVAPRLVGGYVRRVRLRSTPPTPGTYDDRD